MKVKVTLVVDIDADAYNSEYGSDDTPGQIADDIAMRIADVSTDHFRHFTYLRQLESSYRLLGHDGRLDPSTTCRTCGAMYTTASRSEQQRVDDYHVHTGSARHRAAVREAVRS